MNPPYVNTSPASSDAPKPMDMPRVVRTGRIMLFVLGGIQAVVGLLLVTAATLGVGEGTGSLLPDYPEGAYVRGVLPLVLGSAALAVGARFRSGGRGVRIGAMAIAVLILLRGAIEVAVDQTLPLGSLIFGLPLLIYSTKKEAVAWFARPRA
ncbi:hypothetical protein [Streptomyces sp. NPDC001678]|uniref:hypothetical protein n=1 Tax=Streptomyces sp. NPDC001678 TaxID=3364599 RepID=UPI0036958DF5